MRSFVLIAWACTLACVTPKQTGASADAADTETETTPDAAAADTRATTDAAGRDAAPAPDDVPSVLADGAMTMTAPDAAPTPDLAPGPDLPRPPSCGASDGTCPAGCPASDDPDCKKATGQSCNAAADCLTGVCADGYCCNKPCNGLCQSCAAADTKGANGTCLPVKAGADPHDECALQAAATCGTDGTCDGAGACRKYGSSTACGEASCSAGMAQAAGHCDGSGDCTTPAAVSCGGYQCNASTMICRKTCNTDGDCGSAYVCESSTCVARCRAPSKANVIPFAGFDDSNSVSSKGAAGGWAYRDGGGWELRKDGDGCSTSGSARIDVAGRPELYSTCFPVSGGKRYDFGFVAMGNPGESQLATCSVRFFIDCAGDITGTPTDFSLTLTSSWQHADGQVTAPANATAADVYCGVPTFDTAWFDLFYLNASGPHF